MDFTFCNDWGKKLKKEYYFVTRKLHEIQISVTIIKGLFSPFFNHNPTHLPTTVAASVLRWQHLIAARDTFGLQILNRVLSGPLREKFEDC